MDSGMPCRLFLTHSPRSPHNLKHTPRNLPHRPSRGRADGSERPETGVYSLTLFKILFKTMAKICIKFKKPAEADAMGMIYYEVVHRGSRKRIRTRISCLNGEWDPERKVLIKKHGVKTDTRRLQMECDLEMLHAIVARLDRRIKEYTADDVRNEFLKMRKASNVVTFMKEEVSRMEKSGHMGTARTYRRTIDSFRGYMHSDDLTFSGITPILVDGYAAHLEGRGITRNTLSFYMRVLRAAYNKAARRGLVRQSLPFNGVYTGVDKTDKRAIDFDTVMQLNRLELGGNADLAFARDLFMFSFLTRGMSFVDMACLKKEDVVNGEIRYKRKKTGQMLQIRINGSIGTIIRRYDRPRAQFVFPIVGPGDGKRAYRDCQTGLSLYNRRLKRLSAMLGLDRALTSYTARHSWATAAYRMGVPLQLISAGMGHTREETTRIYLASLENWKIDNANDSIERMLAGKGGLSPA